MWPPGSADTVCPRPSVTLTFDRLTLKLVCESHVRWGTFIPNVGTLRTFCSGIIRYVLDGRADRRTDKSDAYCPLPYGRGDGGIITLLRESGGRGEPGRGPVAMQLVQRLHGDSLDDATLWNRVAMTSLSITDTLVSCCSVSSQDASSPRCIV